MNNKHGRKSASCAVVEIIVLQAYNTVMHEFPITENIVRIAEEHCRKAGGAKVRSIKLVVGDYSGYVPESIGMFFDIIAEGGLCEGAGIEFERVKPMLRCPACGTMFHRQPGSFACPQCGSDGEPTDVGKEFYIDSIEIE